MKLGRAGTKAFASFFTGLGSEEVSEFSSMFDRALLWLSSSAMVLRECFLGFRTVLDRDLVATVRPDIGDVAL